MLGNEAKWEGSLDKTAYLYFQGRDSSQAQAARYSDTHTIRLSTGEVASIETSDVSAIPARALWTFPEMAEINRHSRLGISARIKHWFSGFRIRKMAASEEGLYLPKYPYYESGSLHHFTIDSSKVSLSQGTDIDAHRQRFDALMAHRPEVEDVIAWGVSRGGGATFAALARNKYPGIKMCVLEAPAASMRSIFKSYFSSWLGKLLYNRFTAYLFLGKRHSIKKEDQPQAQTNEFPKDIPLVIIASRKDGVVPFKVSYKLALSVAVKRNALKTGGLEVAPVYFIDLDKPGHNEYTLRGSTDSMRYNRFLHAIYRVHKLPYIAEYASQVSATELQSMELTSQQFSPMINFQQAFWDNKSKREEIRQNAFKHLRRQHQARTIYPKAVHLLAEAPLFSKPLRFHNPCAKENSLQSQVKKMLPTSRGA